MYFKLTSSTNRCDDHCKSMHESKKQKETRLDKAAAMQPIASNKLFKSEPTRYHYLGFTIFMLKKLFPHS